MPNKENATKSSGDDFRIHNIQDIIKLEGQSRDNISISEKIANSVTIFIGSMTYVGLHAIWFGAWMFLNLGALPSLKPFDPFPFSLLGLIVSLEAIFLSAFVLISQNKQALQADKRAKVDLQVNLIAEKENTKLIKMITEIQQHLKIHKGEDKEVKELKKPTNVNKLADKIDKD